jgi:Domain of unknown function (DUF4149)
MLALRYAAVLALALWTGGLVVVGAVAAPSIFDFLGARGVDGRVLAAAVVGELLGRFTVIAYGCAGVVLLSLAVRGVLGPRPRRFAFRVAGLLLMIAATVYAGAVLTPRIAAIQRSIGTAPSALAATDPRRVEFGRLHGASVVLQLVPLLGGLALLLWELKD